MKGTKTERSPGVWRLRVFVGTDPTTGSPRQLGRTFRGNSRQADTALAEFVTEAARGAAPMARGTTLDDFMDRWLRHITPTRSPSTIRGYRFKTARISAKLGHLRLDKVTGQDLDRAYREWLEEGLDPSTVNHLHRVLSAALRQAVKWGLLPTAPTALATPPTRRHHSKEIPPPDVVQRLIACAEERRQPILAATIAIAATTGLRRGELAGLRWSDIDFERHRLHVRRAIKNDLDGSWITGAPKTHQTRRVALDAFTLTVFEMVHRRAAEWAATAEVTVERDGYVLTLDPSGATPMRPDTLSQGFARICKAAGIDGVTLHTLRHFSASMLIASGRDVRTIAGRLGHSDPSTTLRVYAHMIEGRDQDAADFLGSLIAPATPAALNEG